MHSCSVIASNRSFDLTYQSQQFTKMIETFVCFPDSFTWDGLNCWTYNYDGGNPISDRIYCENNCGKSYTRVRNMKVCEVERLNFTQPAHSSLRVQWNSVCRWCKNLLVKHRKFATQSEYQMFFFLFFVNFRRNTCTSSVAWNRNFPVRPVWKNFVTNII